MTGELPDVTDAVSVTRVPQVALVADEPPEVIVKTVALEVPADRIVMGSGAVAESKPDVPVMVAVVVPGCTVLSAVRVRMLLVADEAGFQPAVTPEGSPVMENVTFPLKPLRGVTAIDDLSEPPGRRVMVPGAGVTVKAGAVTVSVNAVEAVTAP